MAFGPTITKQAQGDHTSTVIFLHGYGESGIKWSKIAAALNLPNVKVGTISAGVDRTVSDRWHT